MSDSYTPPPGGGSYTPPPPPPPPAAPGGGAPSGSSDRGIMIFLCYFGIFALIPLLTKKEDPEIQWHAKNGLALTIASCIIWVGLFIVSIVLRGILGLIMVPIECVVWLGIFVVDIVAMVKAFGGQRWRIPVVTDFAEKM